MPIASTAYLFPNLGAVIGGAIVPSKTVSIFIDGQKTSFITDKVVLKDALIDEGINFVDGDLIDPDLNTAIDSSKIDVIIKRAVPVTVVDNGNIILGRSAYLSAHDILKDLSINLYADDEVVVASPLDDIILGLKIYINRANVINLQVDGSLHEIHTKISTVKELFKKENIVLNESDRVEPSLDAVLGNNMFVKVIRVKSGEGSEIIDIPFPVQYKESNDLLIGQNKIEQKGQFGKKQIFYNQVFENGVLIKKDFIKEQVLNQPVIEVVIKGVRPKITYARGAYADWINDASIKFGVDASKMQRLMMCESGGNASAVGGGGRFYGLFQYLPSTWSGASSGAGFAGSSIYDPKAQIYTTAWKISKQGYGAWPVCGRK